VPWLLLNGRFAKRTKELVVSGPVGTEQRVNAAWQALYPGSPDSELPFGLRYVEYAERQPVSLGDAKVTPYEVIHQSGAPSYGLQIEYGDRVISYSGDTEWTDSLIDLARGADLFICECNFFDRRVPGHLDYRTITEKRTQLGCERLITTHMGDDVLARLSEIDVEAAADGLTIEV
jgi:ribonuclease BN (tRNA processing enzyme)